MTRRLPTVVTHLTGSARRMAGRLFAMGSIAGFGLAVFVGALSAIDSIRTSRDAWYAAGHLADLELRVAADDVANFPAFGNVPGVADFRSRLILPASIRLPGDERLRALVIVAARDGAAPINSLEIVEGDALDAADRDGVVVERSLARYQGVKVGDVLDVALGGESVRLHVRGIAASAEFLLAPVNPLLFAPSKGSLGVVYANPAVVGERFGFVPANSVLLRVAQGAEAGKVRERVIERARTRLEVDWTATRTEQFGYRFLEKDIAIFEIIVPVIVLFCASSAAIVTVFLFLQWVGEERRSLAVFLALGHSRTEVAASFAMLFAGIALAIVAEGLVVAPLIGYGFLDNFAGAVGLPLPRFAFTAARVLWGIAGVVVILGLAGAIAIARIFRLSPRDAMRHGIALAAVPDRIGSALGRMMPRIWLRMPLRSLFRHRVVSAIGILAVALGLGVAASFFIAYTSFIGTTMNLVARNTWDCTVDFVAPMWDEDVADLGQRLGLTDYTPYTRGVAQALAAGDRVNLYAIGYDADKPWYAVTLVAGRGLDNADASGMLLEQGVARELGLSVGDGLQVEVQGRRRAATVRGLFSGAMPGEARFTLAFHRDLADLGERATGVFVRGPGDPEALARALARDPDVQQVLTKAQAARAILAASGQVIEIARLGEVVSLVIAALSVFASAGYTVLLRRNEYQTLRVLGYRDALITVLVMVEIAFLGAAALLLALPIGALAASYYNGRLSLAWFHVDTIVEAADYARVFVPGIALLLAVALPAARIVLSTPLEAGLRAGEIG